jgi:hypothetical protein
MKMFYIYKLDDNRELQIPSKKKQQKLTVKQQTNANATDLKTNFTN